MDTHKEKAMDDLLANLSSDDSTRDFPSELKALMDETGAVPTEDTKAATVMLYTVALALLEAMLAYEGDGTGKHKAYDIRTGEDTVVDGIPDEIKSALRGGAFVAALGRDEEKDNPMTVVAHLLKTVSIDAESKGEAAKDEDKKMRQAFFKRALDAVRKGRNVTFTK